jgi:hypothetical protein
MIEDPKTLRQAQRELDAALAGATA